MSGKNLVALAASVAAIATACEAFTAKYDVSFRLEPDRPVVSRVWAADEAIPDRVAEGWR